MKEKDIQLTRFLSLSLSLCVSLTNYTDQIRIRDFLSLNYIREKIFIETIRDSAVI